MLLPIILAETNENKDDESKEKFVSIDKLGKFIDYFNYAPINVPSWTHKNESSDDL